MIYRTGALGALMDEYERAAHDLARLIEKLGDDDFRLVRDTQTMDEDCRSIQTIMQHVVRSGYGYANYVRTAFSLLVEHRELSPVSRTEVLDEIERMLLYTANTLEGRWHFSGDQLASVHIQSRWGPNYDIEQMFEHAIVHILRHRRQIERFLSAGPR